MEPIRIPGHVLTGGGDGPVSVVAGEVVVEDGVIVEIRRSDRRRGGSPRLICAGFIDTQVNGTHGVSLADAPDRVDDVSRRLVAEGVTAYLPTVITASDETRDRAVDALGTAVRDDRRETGPLRRGAIPVGIHLEGPLLAPTRRGAHPVAHLREPATCDTTRWTRAHGVAMVTLAPELPGACALIGRLAADGVVVSIGHTDATADQVHDGIAAGATHVTHLFNAMRPFGHRDPGPIGAVLANDTVTAGLICDGVHVDPVAVRMAWRSLGPDRLVLVTDAVAARGTNDGAGDVRTADGALAGSTITLDAAVRNVVAWTGASAVDALRTVTATPARLLGHADRGVLEVGCRADLTVVDERLRVLEVYVGGERAVAAP